MNWTRIDAILRSLPRRLRPGTSAILLEEMRHKRMPSITVMEQVSGLSRQSCRTIAKAIEATQPIPSKTGAYKQKQPGYKGNPHYLDIEALVKWFYSLPHTLEPSASTREMGHDIVDKITRIDMKGQSYPIKRLRRILEFCVGDERPGFNWKAQTRSLSSFRSRSRNGNLKWENAETGMMQQSHEDNSVAKMDPNVALFLERGGKI